MAFELDLTCIKIKWYTKFQINMSICHVGEKCGKLWRTDGRTETRTDGHHHTMIRPVWRRAYKKGPNSFNQTLSKWRLAWFAVQTLWYQMPSLHWANFVPNFANNRNMAEFSTEQKNLPPPAPVKRPVTRLWWYNDYIKYADRLTMFKEWPKFLKGPNKKDLARAGFVYTQVGDKVTCFWCGINFKNWEPFDDAYKEHVRLSKDCTYAKSFQTGCENVGNL